MLMAGHVMTRANTVVSSNAEVKQLTLNAYPVDPIYL